jgi:formyltetrahydrofolate synthetase
MKLYTEQQLIDICQSVAEKMCSAPLNTETIIEHCNYYGHSKIKIDINAIQQLMNDDTGAVINVVVE